MHHAALAQYPAIKLVIPPLEDRIALEEAVARARPEIIVHLAAKAGMRYSIDNPQFYLSSNVKSSRNIIDLAERHKVKHLMLASTSSIYGTSLTVPFHETYSTDT